MSVEISLGDSQENLSHILSSYFNTPHSIRHVGDGCHAAGFIASPEDGSPDTPDVFVRLIQPVGFGHDTASDRLKSMLESRSILPNVLKTHAVLAITPDGMLIEIPEFSEVITLTDVIPSDAHHAGTFMRQQKKTFEEHEALAQESAVLATALTDLMAKIHEERFIGDKNSAESAYQRAQRAIIHDPELTAGVIDFANPPTPWMSHDDSVLLMALMEKVRHLYGIHPERLKKIHGDFWTNNAYIRPTGELLMTDCRLGWGDPAIDAGWVIGEFLMQDLVRFDSFGHSFTKTIEYALETYVRKTEDTDIYRFMALPYAFQTLAEATFTPDISIYNRRRLLATGIGALQASLSGSSFFFKDLNTYIEVGMEKLSSSRI